MVPNTLLWFAEPYCSDSFHIKPIELYISWRFPNAQTIHCDYPFDFYPARPPAHTYTALYLLYARLEEQHGLARRAIRIYERATEAVLPDERFEVVLVFCQENRHCLFLGCFGQNLFSMLGLWFLFITPELGVFCLNLFTYLPISTSLIGPTKAH